MTEHPVAKQLSRNALDVAALLANERPGLEPGVMNNPELPQAQFLLLFFNSRNRPQMVKMS